MARAHQYRFANFVAGQGNAAALATASAAVAEPGQGGRLLVISGGVGVGKTHLARAIVNEARARRPRLRASYWTGEYLAHHLVGIWRDEERSRLARRLAAVEVLAIDDLQLVTGRWYLGPACRQLLAQAGRHCRQIVVCSTRRRGEARGVDGFGLPAAETAVVELAPPDLDTRVRILALRARREGIALPGEVARFVAGAFTRNVRELEGALVRLGAHALLERRELTIALAEEVLVPIRGRARLVPRRRELVPGLGVVPRRGEPSELMAGIRELVEFTRDVGGGRIGDPDVRGQDIFLTLVARDGERYRLRLRVSAYLAQPVGCRFVDDDERCTRWAWPYPADAGPFRSPTFICTPPTAEFYVWHPDRVYRRGEGTLVNTVAAVFAALHAPEYAGRWPRRGRLPAIA